MPNKNPDTIIKNIFQIRIYFKLLQKNNGGKFANDQFVQVY